jgi:pilus assembly protein CpaB
VRLNSFVMVGLAVVFGALAVAASHSWLSRQADAQRRALAAQNKPTEMSTIVVAGQSLRFGDKLTRSVLSEIPWPSDTVPDGAFTSIDALQNDGERVVLASIELNEPVHAAKITGPGQRATLSAIIDEGKRAVTVRVDDVNGVAGFVLPGDRVDVLMTQHSRDGAGASIVVLQGVRVLAIDQMADERAEEPDVAKAVTLEVDTLAAQKIALAASVGTLSLVLRRAGEAVAENTRSITLGDLAPGLATLSVPSDDGPTAQPVQAASGGGGLATVVVSAGDGREEYRVPVERLR